jgi:quercetin dioxygenase-like cupin family protein
MTKLRLILAGAIGIVFAGALLAREPETTPTVEAKQLFVVDFAGDPSKEVNAQVYTFPPGASVPWHIHPDAQEIAYIISGTLTFEEAGQPPRQIEAGEAESLAPNIVHRGANQGAEPVKLFVVRIKPKGTPLVREVPAPSAKP